MIVGFVSMGLTLYLVNEITVLKNRVAGFMQHIKPSPNKSDYL